MARTETSLRPSGIPRLDRVLGGGIRAGDVLLVLGAAGSGKTTLALQMAFQLAAAGGAACFVSTTSESPQRLLEHARSYDFYDESLVGSRLFLLSVFPLLEQGLEPVREALEREVRERKATLVVLDGLATLYDLLADDGAVRRFFYGMSTTLAALGCTFLVTSTRAGQEQEAAELAMADALLRLTQSVQGTRGERHLQVLKVRGQTPLLGLHSMRVDRHGVAVFPRFESLAPTAIPVRQERIGTGFPELDGMLHGGLPAGSFTALAGSVGTGKTLFSLHFLLEGVRSGQRGMLLSLRETEAEAIAKARSFGLDLETPIREGKIVFAYHSPVDLVVDSLLQSLDESLEGSGFQRFVLDGIAELTDAVAEESRRRTLVHVVSGLLRTRGITALIPVPIPPTIGPELDLERTALAALAQNLILMRYVEYHGDLHRILSILKARDSAFDPAIRRYTITSDGLHLLTPTETADGLLPGIARLASEARVRRAGDSEDE